MGECEDIEPQHSPKNDRTRIHGIIDDPTPKHAGIEESESFFNITFDNQEARISDSVRTFRYPMGPRDSINTDNVVIETSPSGFKARGSKLLGSKGGSYSSFFSNARKSSIGEEKKIHDQI